MPFGRDQQQPVYQTTNQEHNQQMDKISGPEAQEPGQHSPKQHTYSSVQQPQMAQSVQS